MNYEYRFEKNNKHGKVNAGWDPVSRCFALQVSIRKAQGETAEWGKPYRFIYDNIGDVLYYFESIGIRLPQHIIQSLLRDRLEDGRQHREIARNTPITPLRVTASGVIFD